MNYRLYTHCLLKNPRSKRANSQTWKTVANLSERKLEGRGISLTTSFNVTPEKEMSQRQDMRRDPGRTMMEVKESEPLLVWCLELS